MGNQSSSSKLIPLYAEKLIRAKVAAALPDNLDVVMIDCNNNNNLNNHHLDNIEKCMKHLNDTFQDEELLCYLCGGLSPKDKLEQMDLLLKFINRPIFQRGMVFALVSKDDPSKWIGLATTWPPGDSFGLIDQVSSIFNVGVPGHVKYRSSWGPEPLARLEAINVISDYHKQFGRNQHHWYIQNISVAIDMQGKGYGAHLLKTMEQLSILDQCPLYLECSNTNVPFYQKCGMIVHRDFVCKGRATESCDYHGMVFGLN